MRKIILGVFVAGIVLLLGGNFVLAREYVSDEIIIKLREGGNEGRTATDIAAVTGSTIERFDKLAGFRVLKLPDGANVEDVVNYYNGQSYVEYAEPNYITHLAWSPNDPNYALQWHFPAINLSQAWDVDTTVPLYGGDPGIMVAVLDTGIAYENYGGFTKATDFTGSYPAFVSGYDYINDDAHPNDDHGHGTHVSSTIAQSTNNGLYSAGIAFNTTLMPVKVCHVTDGCPDDAIASGLTFAKNNGADIVNMSISGLSPQGQVVQDALVAAEGAGVVMFAATGNDYLAQIGYPAKFSETIAVGATRYNNNQRASYSNYGEGIDLVAPGGESNDNFFNGWHWWAANYVACTYAVPPFGDVNCVAGDGVYQQSFYKFFVPVNYPANYTIANWYAQGTSMATPHAAGVAALLRSYGVPANNIRSVLNNSATDLGVAGYDYEYGHGLLNAADAFSFPTITEVSPSSGDNATKTDITIMGTNFAVGVTAKIGTTDLTNVNVVSGTSMTAVVPKNLSAGIYDISVVVNGKTVTAEGAFTVIDSPPNDVSRLRVTTKNKKVIFKWVNPTNSDFKKVKILRKKKRFPRNSSDGKVVFHKKKTKFTNKRLKKRKYYYKIFTYDTVGNYSSGGPVVVVPIKESVKAAGQNNNLASGDLNADGKSEIILGAKKGEDPKIYIINKNGKNIFKKNGFYPFGKGARNCGINVAVGDFNGNGKDDIVASKGAPCKTKVKVFNRKGKKKFKKKGFKPFKGKVGVTVAAGDLNGNNVDEIVVGAESGKAKVKTYQVSGKKFVKVFKKKGWRAFSGSPGVKVFSGDVNYDGRDEIVAVKTNGSKEIRVYKKNGKKRFRKKGWHPYGTGYTGSLRVAVGDASSNGYAEILTSSSDVKQVRAWGYQGRRTTPTIKKYYSVGENDEFVVGRFK